MRVSWLQVVRLVECRADVATVRTILDEHGGAPALPDGVSLIRFTPSLVAAVVAVQSPRRGRQFLQFDAEGGRGWLATDGSGTVIGYCWRLDNAGRSAIQREVTVPSGWSWFHHAWTAPAWRGQGIFQALLRMVLDDALTQPAWPVKGFVTGIAADNSASRRGAAKVGFRPVRRVTSLRVGLQWFSLHSEVMAES